MPTKGGAALKTLQTLLRLIQFLAALLILGIFAYFIASRRNNSLPRSGAVIAVEIIAAIALVYTLLAVLLTCFIGGITAFGILGVLFDLLLIGGFIAIAVLTRQGRRSCSGYTRTPLGRGFLNRSDVTDINDGFGFGNQYSRTYRPNLRRACRLNRTVFIVSLVMIGLLLLSAILQMMLVRHHKKEKRYGPSPANGYTNGSGKKKGGLFAFGKKKRDTGYNRDAELATAGTTGGPIVTEKPAHNPNLIRPSHETGYTGSTMASSDPYGVHKQGHTHGTTGTNTTTTTTHTHGHTQATTGNIAVNPGHNHAFSGPVPHGTGPLHNYATSGATY